MRPRAGLLLLTLLAAEASAGAPPPANMSAAATRAMIADGLAKGDAAAVAGSADRLAAMGGGLSAESQQRIAPLLPEAKRKALRAAFAENVEPLAVSEAYATIPAKYRLVEGLAFDARTRRLFAGTVVDGRLLVNDQSGWRAIALPEGLGGLFGMAIDGRRRRLWVANGVAEPVADRASITPGLVEIDIDTLQVVDHHPMPAGAEGTAGDVTIGPDGTLYASDGVKGGIYRCPPGCSTLSMLVAPGQLPSPQGMVISADRTALIVADYRQGLARIALADGAISWLSAAVPEMLDGIDGLVRDGASLLAIQNGTTPCRIIRILLDEDEKAVDRIAVVERANPQWGEPTLGTLVGDKLVYIADGQWEVYGPGGAVKSGAAPRDTPLRAITRP